MPSNIPGIGFGKTGLCDLCTAWQARDPVDPTPENRRRDFEADLELTLAQCPRLPGRYDCIVPFSGGKDSIYLLYRLKEQYRLNVLALTVSIDLPEIAWNNIRRTIGRLNIDHHVITPSQDFLKRIFRYALSHQEARGAVHTLSYIYASLFEGEAIKLAIEKGIPLILAGYSPGQPDPDRILYEFGDRYVRQDGLTPLHIRDCGLFDDDLWRFYTPSSLPAGTRFPRYLAPFHAWPYSQDDIISQVVSLGLVRNKTHASPVFSNYPINWLMMYSDLRHLGYNPYRPEFCALIREGKASRRHWKLWFPVVDFMIRHRLLLGAHTTRVMRWLNIDNRDLRITLPKGAYDSW